MHNQQSAAGTAAAAAVSAVPSRYILLCTAFLSLLLVFTLLKGPTQLPPPSEPHPALFPRRHRILFNGGEGEVYKPGDSLSPPRPPSLAYFISGSANESRQIIRLLYAVYHPLNHYLLHLDGSASQTDRDALAVTVQSVRLFRAARNVHVIGKGNNVCPDGPSALSATLHGASIMLRLSADWDWFINLSASDYPLVTQDDLLHIFSYLPRNLNFVNHTGYIGWRELKKLKRIIVDPALSLTEKTEIFFATQKRQLPDAYRLFIGPSTTVLSRKFIEFCILGTDNLPRALLMYVSNTPASASMYFPTVLCNAHQFNWTTINHGLHYTSLDSRQRRVLLNSSNFAEIIDSGAAFASPFPANDPFLDRIDREVLQRSSGEPVPGGWCLGDAPENVCNLWGDADILKPSSGAKRLEKRLVEVLSTPPPPCLAE
ncbi:beta-glucuronosyltransferase GlcAT14A [Andrographis paniculata]|uniref:beta-glucuronosyltransferase GlcAT14A n=1 Tax=Andrographis paniculata TaxID=175694 RepID=UPI0021E9894D|nr:beta-glucuronosyltransferase GlcAT14A [Andrographis paniculata]